MISFQSPPVYIFLCLLLGGVYALTLYFRHSFIKDPTSGQKRLMNLLGVLRFTVISLIAILLLSPFIKSKFTEVQKPVILVLQDNSESVKYSFAAGDSAAYAAALKAMVEKLKRDFDVKEYSFDEMLHSEISFSWDGKLTNLSDNLNDLISLYARQNVGAIILASDGIYNKGANPLYNAGNLKFPVYTVALGDTTPRRDLKLSKVLYNQMVYLNDRFKIRVDAEADNMPSAKTSLDVFDLTEKGNPKKLESKEVVFSPKTFLSEEFVLEANKAGMHRYQVALRPLEGEFTKANNYMDLFVDVLDSRQKILLAAHSPHPDLAAIRDAIESNRNYEVTLKFADELSAVNPEDFNLLVLHQLPSQRFPMTKLLESVREKSTAVFYIIGGQTALPVLNNQQSALQASPSGNDVSEAIPLLNKDFPLFTFSDALQMRLADFPPLYVPFGQYSAAPTAKVMLYQKIGAVQTGYPLLLFDDALGAKTAILCGEGMWRWKMYDYRQNKNFNVFNELVTKAVQYLAVKEDKRQFRVRIPKNVFYENESISFQAELYNDSYELINEPDVSLRLVDDEGKEYPFIFNKTSNAYMLEAGNFPVGNYSFNASVKYGTKELSYSGKFSIVPMQLEAFSTVANHQMLYQLSEKSGGKMFYPSQLQALGDSLSASSQMKPVMLATYKTDSLINLWWLLLVFAAILALEWFIRKYEGGY
ncbi:MAG TPA: hypothetical protein VNJ07_12050 [Chitinophagales bacterium]|nr:hypothetical protein [Chitinophagales bacterium]